MLHPKNPGLAAKETARRARETIEGMEDHTRAGDCAAISLAGPEISKSAIRPVFRFQAGIG
jgi:hypothetical protein